MKLSEARHAFVTGGASGIGLGIAGALADRGIAVTLADMDEEALAAAVAARGNAFRAEVLDVRDRDGWARAKEQAEAASGPVDILVNNAGIAPNGMTFADMDPASFDRILAINLVGVFNGVSAFAAGMQARGRGHIVNTSSQAGLTAGMPGVGAYTVAKFGVTALSETLRVELAPHGVGVTVLCPGYIVTNLTTSTARLGGERRQYSDVVFESDVTTAMAGEMVAEAIERDAAFVVTHKGVGKSIEARTAAILEACAWRDAH